MPCIVSQTWETYLDVIFIFVAYWNSETTNCTDAQANCICFVVLLYSMTNCLESPVLFAFNETRRSCCTFYSPAWQCFCEMNCSTFEMLRRPCSVLLIFCCQEAAGLLGDENLGDTRAETKRKGAKKPALKRKSTVAAAVADGMKIIQTIQAKSEHCTLWQFKDISQKEKKNVNLTTGSTFTGQNLVCITIQVSTPLLLHYRCFCFLSSLCCVWWHLRGWTRCEKEKSITCEEKVPREEEIPC